MNINVNIGEILIKAWKITWKFKVLWVFGILASFASSRGSFNSGNSGGSGNGGGNIDNGLPDFFQTFQSTNWSDRVNSFLSSPYGVIIVVCLLLLCILSFVFYALAMVGRVGLIKGAHKADLGAEKIGFGEVWTESLPYFWRMVALSLVVALPIFIFVVILLVVFFLGIMGAAGQRESGGAALGGLFALLGVFIPAICCFVIAVIVLNLIVGQARIALVIENLGVFESLRRGWDVFKRNFLTIIIVSIILGVIGGVVGFIIAIPIILAFLPSIASIFIMASSEADKSAALMPLAISGICCLAYLPVLLILRGVSETYDQSVLTLTYLRLTAPVPEPPAAPVEIIDAQ